jgi:two-component system, OmpR family, sensor histidine kinase CiaH
MDYRILKNKLIVKPLRVIYVFYWFLLAYILAALIFWFIALNTQNKELVNFRIQGIESNETNRLQEERRIKFEGHRKIAQYIGEGVTFLLLILTGAVLVFRFIQKQLVQSQQQRNFMMAITHELKTPIAVTKLNLETMQIRKLEFGQQQKLIRSTIQEANRLNTLCNNMLLLSQIDTGGYTLTKEKIDLATLANDSAEDFIARFPERKIEVDIQDETIIIGDRLSLQLAINNLLDNALKYSGKEDVVLIKVFKENKKIRLQVIDTGYGISAKEKERIFEKYFRGAQMQTKGTGLGLYLTKEIVKQHHAYISITNNIPRGCIFEMQFRPSKNS